MRRIATYELFCVLVTGRNLSPSTAIHVQPVPSISSEMPQQKRSHHLQEHMQEQYLAKCKELNELKEHVQSLQKELQALQARDCTGGPRRWGYHAISDTAEKVAYYTGLPNEETFMWVVDLYKNATEGSPKELLDPEDKVLLVLMRLRLDIHLCFLADLFGLGKNSVSKQFETTLTVLVAELKGLVVWPDDVAFHTSKPKLFRGKYRRVRVIIDST